MPFIEKVFVIDQPTPALHALCTALALSPAEAGRLIDKRRVVCETRPVVRKNESVAGRLAVTLFEACAAPLAPLAETGAFALFDKPSGMLVHPRKLDATPSLLDSVHALYGPQANIVHRIDRETSGLVLVSRTKEAEGRLKAMFRERSIEKVYLALVRGRLESRITIDVPLCDTDPASAIRLKGCVSPTGLPSVTRIVPLAYDPDSDTTLIEAHPLTGRQHQIRLHLFHVKHPIIGDPLYGPDESTAISYLEGKLAPNERQAATGASRLMLHAARLRMVYDGESYDVTAPIPWARQP